MGLFSLFVGHDMGVFLKQLSELFENFGGLH